MQARRLLDNLHAQQNKSLDEFFGNPVLLDDRYSRTPSKRVKRVAVLTESFLPKVDGVVKTTYLTIRYLQETGREVLILRRILRLTKLARPRLCRCAQSACQRRRKRAWPSRIPLSRASWKISSRT